MQTTENPGSKWTILLINISHLFFQRTIRVQLGHIDDGLCPLPQTSFNNEFTVIDSDRVHEIALDYCGCQYSLPKTIQLLRAGLFPSTVIDPKTAATFWVLETFQMLSFTSKVSGFEYYRSLERRTDNTGTSLPPVRSF